MKLLLTYIFAWFSVYLLSFPLCELMLGEICLIHHLIFNAYISA